MKKDWHRADIIAALHKQRTSIAIYIGLLSSFG
ncbi:helix-turn-helix domain-containing protein [Dickeya zeae]|nr:helix-turn-helix domain-containing protein [Dickeya zeae]UCZ77050.1 helix-turn-helix domain-containing protein [Dickeya zeae]